MPRRAPGQEDLFVVVPSGRAFFGGGLDNPADQAPRGRSSTSKKRNREPRPFPTAPPPAPPPGPPTFGLSSALDGMGIADGPISARTRMRKRLGFPKPANDAIEQTPIEPGDESWSLGDESWSLGATAQPPRRLLAPSALAVTVPSALALFGGGLVNSIDDDAPTTGCTSPTATPGPVPVARGAVERRRGVRFA